MKKTVIIFIASIVFINLSAQDVGIGTTTPTQKLDVVGNLRVSGAIMPGGIAGNAGQVLISSGTGTAPTWQNMAYSGLGRFAFTYNNNSNTTGRIGFSTTVGTSQEDTLDIVSVTYNTTADVTINTSVNTLTINTTGLYHFEGMMRYFVTSNTTSFARAALKFYFDAPPVGSPQSFYVKEDIFDQTGNVGNNKYNLGLGFSIDRHLVAGTIVAFSTEINNLALPVVALGISSGGFVSGYLIAE